jgi:hypothetical protein
MHDALGSNPDIKRKDKKKKKRKRTLLNIGSNIDYIPVNGGVVFQ